MDYEPVIGLEVHVQLKTNTKMFTRVPYQFGAEPNTLTNPVVMGLPGTLPVLNYAAIEQTVKVGLLFGANIAEVCKWDRKNYFYPDNPKNYQISQYDQPLCEGGEVEIELPGSARNVMGPHRMVKLTRAHLEEDVGKLTHFGSDSLVDYNRAGVPLLEIVTEPDLFSAEEAVAFLNALRITLSNAGISDCDMEKGQMRCDANVSIRPKGASTLGNRNEMKNLNSVSGVKAAIDYEIKRQSKVLDSGGFVEQETRRWNAEKGYTVSMRTKENAQDYRYFPDPDLMPVKFPRDTIESLREGLPEKPFDQQRRFMEEYNLPYTVTSVICPSAELAAFFETSVAVHSNPKAIANWMVNDLLRELSAAVEEGSLPLRESPISPEGLAELVKVVDEGVISNQIAKGVFAEMFATGKDPKSIIEAKGLQQNSNRDELASICQEVIDKNPKPVTQFKEGKLNAINALKGQVMKATKGQANPRTVDEFLRNLLNQ